MMNWIISDCLEVVDLDVPSVLSRMCLLGRNAMGWQPAVGGCGEKANSFCVLLQNSRVVSSPDVLLAPPGGCLSRLPSDAALLCPTSGMHQAIGTGIMCRGEAVTQPARDYLCFLDDRNKFSGYICCSCLSVGNLSHQMQTTIVMIYVLVIVLHLRHLARLPPLLTAISLATPLPFQPSNYRNISSLRGQYQ